MLWFRMMKGMVPQGNNKKGEEEAMFSNVFVVVTLSIWIVAVMFNIAVATTCTLPPSGMISWWGGDNNAFDIYGSNHGTLMNGTTYAQGLVGQAFSFDGLDDVVVVPNSPSLNVTTQFTLAAWVHPKGYQGGYPDMGVITKHAVAYGQYNGYLIALHRQGSTWQAFCQFNGVGEPWPTNQVFGGTIADLSWHHIACTYDHNDLKIYVDGVLVGIQQVGSKTVSNSSAPLRIGNDLGLSPFYGYIDEAVVFNRALTAQEVGAIYMAGNSGKCRPCASSSYEIVAWWDAEGDADDIIGIHHGILRNGVTFAGGKVGRAFSFDGVDDYVEVPHHERLNTGEQLTIEGWIKPFSMGHGRPFLQKRTATNIGGFTFETTHSDKGQPANGLQFAIWIGGTPYLLQTAANVISVNSWHHVAATYDGINMRIFVDGMEKASFAVSGAIDPTDAPVVMGLNVTNPSFVYHGLIDEMTLYNRALSAQEIAAIYNAGMKGKCPFYQYGLTVTITGTGEGRVSSNPEGINCRNVENVAIGKQITPLTNTCQISKHR